MHPMLTSILISGATGSILFTVFLVMMARSGIAAEIRDEEGQFKKISGKKAWFGLVFFVLFLLSVLTGGNLLYEELSVGAPAYIARVSQAFGVFFFIHAYDLFIIDYLIVVKWHPQFLKLPDTPYYTTVKPHLDGFIRGIPIGIVFSAIAAALSLYI